MRRMLHSPLPERLKGRVPTFAVEIAVGLLASATVVFFRMALQPLVGDAAPYTFVALGMIVASVVAGWRSGLVALVTGQLLTWYAVLEPQWTFVLPDRVSALGLVLATGAQSLILALLALYQREVHQVVEERERRLDLLHQALNEIDHRTRNNYQTVLALVHLQAQRSQAPEVKAALQQVGERIQAIAQASERLALRSADIGRVRLDDHLCGLCEQIERGLSREEIAVACNVDEVTASPDKATSISLIVNELVTNAIKHAFNGQGSGSVQVTGKSGPAFELTIADDGHGIAATRRNGRTGLGTRLVESFVRQLGAQHEVVSTDKGTTHRLVIPDLD